MLGKPLGREVAREVDPVIAVVFQHCAEERRREFGDAVLDLPGV
jgi:hypothetical protein